MPLTGGSPDDQVIPAETIQRQVPLGAPLRLEPAVDPPKATAAEIDA